MVNSDKVKAAQSASGAPKYAQKVQAIHNAQRKAHKEAKRVQGVHASQAVYEDSMCASLHDVHPSGTCAVTQ